MKTSILFLFAIATLAITGCQTLPYQPYARTVKSKPQEGGVIALKINHRDEDSAKAQELMAKNCGANQVKVLEEGEVVVGEQTSTTGNTSHERGSAGHQVGSFFGMPVVSGGRDASDSTNSVASTSAIKEWQISYECVAANSDKKTKKHYQ